MIVDFLYINQSNTYPRFLNTHKYLSPNLGNFQNHTNHPTTTNFAESNQDNTMYLELVEIRSNFKTCIGFIQDFVQTSSSKPTLCMLKHTQEKSPPRDRNSL